MLPNRFERTIGFLAGGVVFGATMFVLAWGSAVQQRAGVFWNAGFYVTMVGYVGSFVVPVTFVRFVAETHSEERTYFWPKFFGYVFAVLAVFFLGRLGVSVLGPAGVDSAVEMYALLNGWFGFILGGIFGVLVADRLRDRRRYEGFGERAPGRYG